LDCIIYRIIQEAYNWEYELDRLYEILDYIWSRADLCIRFWKRNGKWTITRTYTNDVIVLFLLDEEKQKI